MAMWKRMGVILMTGALGVAAIPAVGMADTQQPVPQGIGSGVLQNASYFGNVPGSTPVTVDIVMKIQHQDKLEQFVAQTTDPKSPNFRRYLTPTQFQQRFAPSDGEIQAITDYLAHFGIQSQVYPDHLIITANGTAEQFNRAFNVVLQWAEFNGKRFHAAKANPKVPAALANDILCVLGLSDYSRFTTRFVKQADASGSDTPAGPLNLTPQDLIQHYDVAPLYKRATGQGQTIGIVTLADFNAEDAYAFWDQMGIPVKANRITEIPVDGGTGWDGYEETTLDVQQSGALAPQADIRVYEGPNSDTGFIDTFAKAINEDIAQQISVSWGESEPAIQYFVDLKMETPQYAYAYNQLFMQAAAQGQSMFAAAGDEGAYDAVREFGLGSGVPGVANLSVDNPADSPYITAAGGTTLPFHFHSPSTGIDVVNEQERAWGWDYLYPYFDARGLNNPDQWAARYLVGGGGGFSAFFPTPAYQSGVPGVNRYTGVQQWLPSSDGSSLTRASQPTLVTGSGTGRNMPDLSMNADPYTGYLVYLSDPGQPGVNAGYATYGGTSFVSPQLAGLSALINDADHTRVGFWNPQIYRFAVQKNSPFTPLNESGPTNDNDFYTGTPGTVYNQATGLGIPDVARLASAFSGHR
ncbi:protease pro-enzyme activation domain-containing protein [Alicyclobacillus sp.]|uniref:S53 family peptidase n=1 Tax=Alicyclobacillus sp. TaxID=61169 RepID=UPI0025BEE466|nr:protease pro-enzyme activation domain-containing protein [Alicyclobacillus sp.]MCL6516042.1 S8 family serine peptidase [Alicyclobacillus sp.]